MIVFLLWCCVFDFQLRFIRRLGVDKGWKNSHDVSRELSLRSCSRGLVYSSVQVVAFMLFGGPSFAGDVCMCSLSLNVCCVHRVVAP